MISGDLTFLRKAHGYSQEQVAEEVGGIPAGGGKWESGETAPDLPNSVLLAKLYQVTLDNLVNYDSKRRSPCRFLQRASTSSARSQLERGDRS